jgi:hypothetical protein
VFCRLNYDESNARNRMTLPLSPVEKIVFIFYTNGGGAGIVFKIKTTISRLGF